MDMSKGLSLILLCLCIHAINNNNKIPCFSLPSEQSADGYYCFNDKGKALFKKYS